LYTVTKGCPSRRDSVPKAFDPEVECGGLKTSPTAGGAVPPMGNLEMRLVLRPPGPRSNHGRRQGTVGRHAVDGRVLVAVELDEPTPPYSSSPSIAIGRDIRRALVASSAASPSQNRARTM
jgi:hypothetical protein